MKEVSEFITKLENDLKLLREIKKQLSNTDHIEGRIDSYEEIIPQLKDLNESLNDGLSYCRCNPGYQFCINNQNCPLSNPH